MPMFVIDVSLMMQSVKRLRCKAAATAAGGLLASGVAAASAPAEQAAAVQSQTFKQFGCTLAVAVPQATPAGIVTRMAIKCNRKGAHSLILGAERVNPPGTWPPEPPRTLTGAVGFKALVVPRKHTVHVSNLPFTCIPGTYDTFVQFGQKRKGTSPTAVFRTSAVQVTC
jgi:citrate lyase gamma subunit